jgi:Flp pilus assembly protein TadG
MKTSGLRCCPGGGTETGAVALIVAIMVPLLLILAGVAIDAAMWYREGMRLQTAADAAALAGVTSMNSDSGFDTASMRALQASAMNGYPNAGQSSVVPFTTSKKSELGVSVTSTIRNNFGAIFGQGSTTITRTAIADYQGAAIMGSPCNAFGNQPQSNTQAALAWNNGNHAIPASGTVIPDDVDLDGDGDIDGHPTCQEPPEMWAVMQGPGEDKSNGDRYATKNCDGSNTDCDVPNNVGYDSNKEYRPNGYFWVVRVEEGAVGSPISLQIYDPAYIRTESDCSALPDVDANGATGGVNGIFNNMSPWAPDALVRYDNDITAAEAATSAIYCPGDRLDNSNDGVGMTTSFGLRYPSPTLDPMKADPYPNCARQFAGRTSSISAGELATGGSFNLDLTRNLHQWVELCSFTPLTAGDYYLQVRTNISMGSDIYTSTPNEETQPGVNAFALRANVDPIAKAQYVAISGWERMPIRVNAQSGTPTFNLIQVLSNAADKNFEFSFYDVGDGLGGATGTVKILYPLGARLGGTLVADGTSPAECEATYPGGTSGQADEVLTSCTADITSNKNDRRVEKITVQVPGDYTCDYTSLGSCWFRARIDYKTSTPTDTTTWDAFINGDSVRLVR